MTTTLKPHDFYVKLSEFTDEKARTSGTEELGYFTAALEKWEKCRFAETNELSFAYLRNWAIDNATDAELMTALVELIDAHVEENLKTLFPAHATNARKLIGIPEPAKEEEK